MDYVLKMVVIGDSAVGKTQLLSRFSKNEFRTEGRATVGVEFQTKTIPDMEHRRPGAMPRRVASAYYCSALGTLIVCDITKYASFEQVPRWLDEPRAHADPNVVIMLTGNKCDLEGLRQCQWSRARSWHRERDCSSWRCRRWMQRM